MHDLTRQAALGRVFAIPLMGMVLALAFAASAAAGQFTGLVVGITDGDTVKVLDEQRVLHTVRLAGIDAPEKKQPFGQRAKQHLSDLAFNRSVVVEGEKLDRYGRLVGKILVSGEDANLSLVSSGLAWHYKAYQKEQSPEDRRAYSDAENIARMNRRGLWADSDSLPPWLWRALPRQKKRSADLLD